MYLLRRRYKMTANIEKRQKSIAEFLTNPVRQKQLEMALPKVGITKERMLRLMFSSLVKTPKLMQCTPDSLYNSMIQVASLGLEPNTALGHAYLIPFGSSVQLIIGYKGYLTLARRSGELSSISSHVVREGDDFEFEYGTDEHLKHKPARDNTSAIIYAYCVAKFKNGSSTFEVMTKADVDAIRARSKSAHNGPWVTDYEQMARKTVVRRLMNYLPLSIEIARAAAMDGQNEVGVQDMSEILDVEATEVPQEQPAPKPDSLEAMAEESQPPEKAQGQNATDTTDTPIKNMSAMIKKRILALCEGDENAMDQCLSGFPVEGIDIKPTVDNLESFTIEQLSEIYDMAGVIIAEAGEK
jgi:recombination protein RecT